MAEIAARYDTGMSKKEMEMIRICGSIPAATIDELKKEMSEYIKVNRKNIMELEGTYPAPFDYKRYKEEHNHIELTGPETATSQRGFWGSSRFVSDIHELDEEDRNTVMINEIVPPIILNDLVVRVSNKSVSGKRMYYEVHSYDPERELMYISRYQHYPAEEKTVAPAVKEPVLFGVGKNPARLSKTEYIPAHVELIESAIIPVRWVFSMLVVGMNCGWASKEFSDFPVLFTWHEDEPYQLYRNFARKNLTFERDNGEHGIVEDVIDASIGFQRYLVALTEDRESVSIKKDKPQTDAIRKTTLPNESKGDGRHVRHVISLKDDIRIYTNTNEGVKRFRHFRKCAYRFSVRGHFRHYKNGKTVWIRPFDKNKNKPFNSHKYGED